MRTHPTNRIILLWIWMKYNLWTRKYQLKLCQLSKVYLYLLSFRSRLRSSSPYLAVDPNLLSYLYKYTNLLFIFNKISYICLSSDTEIFGKLNSGTYSSIACPGITWSKQNEAKIYFQKVYIRLMRLSFENCSDTLLKRKFQMITDKE